jgi:chromosome segregation ATPase
VILIPTVDVQAFANLKGLLETLQALRNAVEKEVASAREAYDAADARLRLLNNRVDCCKVALTLLNKTAEAEPEIPF